MPIKGALTLFFYLATVVALPLLALGASGRQIAPFFTFPPRTQLMAPEPFSWPAFWLVTLIIVVSLAPFLQKISRTAGPRRTSMRYRGPFPGFGWLGLVLIGVTWVVAWNRFPWASSLQRLTFTPLWLGYIVVVNALIVTRSGACPMISETRLFITLFPLSAVFWWSFEYLNRFVNNWYYPGTQYLGAGPYVLEVTLPFSTVLPAVYTTAVWLATFPRLARGLDRFIAPRPTVAAGKPFVMLAVAASLLVSTATCPILLFPLVWIAPPLLMAGLQQLLLGHSLLHRAFASGDFRRLWCFALAGLVCGVFWELWNFRSLAHWEYQIPYVGRFHLFAMPLLGYAGYLPFGIACATFIDSAKVAFERQDTTLAG